MNRRPKDITVAQQKEAWSLRRKLWSLQRIATKLGVDESTVSRMLKREEDRLTKEFTEQALVVKLTQAAQLEFIAEEAMEAWEKSKEPGDKERTVVKRLGAKPKEQKPAVPEGPDEVPGMYLDASDDAIEDAGEITDEDRARLLGAMGMHSDGSPLTIVEETSTLERRYQVGDPRFLEQARGALSDIRTIWGAEAPKKAEVSGPNGTPLMAGFEAALNRVYGDSSSNSTENDATEPGG